MPSQEIMQKIIDLLKEFGLQVTTSEGEVDLPYEAALVDFGTDDQDRPVILQLLHYSHEMLSSFEESKLESPPIDLSVLSFLITIPVEIPLKNTPEVLRLVSLVNKALPLGALNFSEVEKAVYYSYSLPVFAKPPDEAVLVTILHTALFVKETFFSAVDAIATGQATVDDLLKEADQSISTSKA